MERNGIKQQIKMSYIEPEAKIFACSKSVYLAEQIAEKYGVALGKVTFSTYSDGEFQPSFEESIRGLRVFLVCSTFPSSDNLMELLLMIDAAKRASARHITAVIPYFGWARQDRKDKPRVPIGAKLVAKLLETAGATRIMTMDLHADQIQGFFEKPVDHLFASTIFLPYVRSLNLENLTIASPDMGGSKRAYAYSKFLESDVVVCYKQRKKANVIDTMELIGDVKGRNVILVDDMIDTGGTLAKAADVMMEKGALSVRAICTHAILSGEAYEKIENSKLLELIVTDSIPLKKESKKIRVVSCAPLFAEVMHMVQKQQFDKRKVFNVITSIPIKNEFLLIIIYFTMKSITIKGSERENVGKKATKAVRDAGMVPCVIYGGNQPVHLQQTERAFKNLVYTPNAHTVVIELEGGKKIDAILQDIQFHPVSDKILHIDFFQLSDEKEVVMEIPVKVTGKSPGVMGGGVLRLNQRRLKVKALPKDLPDFIEADITPLQMGNKLYITKVPTNNFKFMHPDNTVVCQVRISRAAMKAAQEAAKAEKEAGKKKK